MLLKSMYENHCFYHRNDGWPSPSTACAHVLCEEVPKTSIISVFFAILLKNIYKNNTFYYRNEGWSSPSTACAHKTCSKDHKNGNRDKSGKSSHVCTGYRNIIGAPQAYAIWGIMFFTIETTAHHHQVPRGRIQIIRGDPRVIKNHVFYCVLCQEVSKTLIISMLFVMAAEEPALKQCFLPSKRQLTITKYHACAWNVFRGP